MIRPQFLTRGIVFGIGALLAGVVHAAVPTEVSIQGVLRDSQGQLQSMPVNVKVEFFDAESNGVSIAGPFMSNAVVVTSGLFTISVSDAGLATDLGNTTSAWVEITVNGTDVFPRQKITSEVFALRAAAAERLACAGCVDNSMISSVAAIKVTGKVASASGADTAAALSCTGCVTDSMMGGVAASKVSGKVSAATAADTAAALSCTGCVTNAMMVAVDGAKVTGTVASATNAAQLGGVAAANYLQTTSGLNGANLTTGSVTAAKIATGALTHGHTATLNVVAGTPGSTPVPPGVGIICGTCPGGTTVVSGTCTSTGLGSVVINDSFVDFGLNRWCCRMANNSGVMHTITVTPNCASISITATSIP